MKQTIGIVGLGPMGKTIAINLLSADFLVYGYDIRSELRHDLESYGGVSLSAPAEIADSVDVLITSLPNSSALDLVINDVLKTPRPELVFVETSTLTVDQKLKAAKQLGDDGISLLDCPISGTPGNVTDQLLAFRDEGGPFGTLLYAGHDWKDRELAVRSMELMATKVMPAINLATGE